jgi:NADP-dependent 3-hydroxy acid dehydrogenase YdfG
MQSGKGLTAVVTGASAGIGSATALKFAEAGFSVVLGARRMEQLSEVAARCEGRALALDVTDPSSVAAFAGEIPAANVLVNNAGMAAGLDPLEDLTEERARAMWDTNVMGLMRVTQALLPKLEASGAGHIINIGSVAGRETYRGGGGYTASKHAVLALTKTMRLELLGRPVRVTDISPGLVETEFSMVRFEGDAEKAAGPYKGMTPLRPEDIADCIVWAATRPWHVNIDEIVVKPLAQATATQVDRSGRL